MLEFLPITRVFVVSKNIFEIQFDALNDGYCHELIPFEDPDIKPRNIRGRCYFQRLKIIGIQEYIMTHQLIPYRRKLLAVSINVIMYQIQKEKTEWVDIQPLSVKIPNFIIPNYKLAPISDKETIHYPAFIKMSFALLGSKTHNASSMAFENLMI